MSGERGEMKESAKVSVNNGKVNNWTNKFLSVLNICVYFNMKVELINTIFFAKLFRMLIINWKTGKLDIKCTSYIGE